MAKIDPAERGVTYQFEITGVRGRWRDRAARYALSSLTANKWISTDTDMIAMTQLEIIRAWRTRVRGLAAQGWELAQGAKPYFFLVNCPPVGVYTNITRRKTCQVAYICPFCWCRRYVHSAFDKLEAFYYDTVQEGPRPEHLVEYTRRLSWDARKFRFELLLCLLHDQRLRRASHRELRPNGAFRLTVLSPPDFRQPRPCWISEQRMLAVMPVEGYNLPVEDVETEVVRHLAVNREILVQAVGRVCKYPRQLMYGPTNETVDLLNFLACHGGRGHRMSATYGKLRRLH